jgi:hypothetical protein
MNAPILPDWFELYPLAIDPRSCRCGLTIDRHEMIDGGDGPLFFCPDQSPDDMTLEELERRTELRRQEDVAAILAAMPECPPIVPVDKPPEPYRTPQATRDAFWHVVSLADPEKFKAWLDDHPKDARFLIKLLEGK